MPHTTCLRWFLVMGFSGGISGISKLVRLPRLSEGTAMGLYWATDDPVTNSLNSRMVAKGTLDLGDRQVSVSSTSVRAI